MQKIMLLIAAVLAFACAAVVFSKMDAGPRVELGDSIHCDAGVCPGGANLWIDAGPAPMAVDVTATPAPVPIPKNSTGIQAQRPPASQSLDRLALSARQAKISASIG